MLIFQDTQDQCFVKAGDITAFQYRGCSLMTRLDFRGSYVFKFKTIRNSQRAKMKVCLGAMQWTRAVNTNRAVSVHITVISKHITAPCDLLQDRDDIFSSGTKKSCFCAFVFSPTQDKPCILNLVFPCEKRPVGLSH